jgi:hypothetical protein
MTDLKTLKFTIASLVLFAVSTSATNQLLAQSTEEQSTEELAITGPAGSQEIEAPQVAQKSNLDEKNAPKTFSVLEFPIEQSPMSEAKESVQLKPPTIESALKLEPPQTVDQQAPDTSALDAFLQNMVRPPENFDVAPGAVPGRVVDDSKKTDAASAQPSNDKRAQSKAGESKTEKDNNKNLPKMNAPTSTNYRNTVEPARRGLFYRFRQNRIPTSPGPQNASDETLRIRVPANPNEQPFAYRSDTFQQEPQRRIRLFRRR